MILDLGKASAALSGIKTSEGQKNLDELYKHLESFRGKLDGKLNDAEFRYVMQTLFNEQVLSVPAAEARNIPPATVLAHGFSIRQMI
ncbi:MAG: hypothetical protein V4564_00085 [Pseudomonadota bacterium]|uniref:hypothetical protein n=1 Tax=Sphingomonas sp. ERG5 TaxID=1381597 RepID=UPI00054C4962|nr:hypothetical protein [Sphingomonas sp. ERG5]